LRVAPVSNHADGKELPVGWFESGLPMLVLKTTWDGSAGNLCNGARGGLFFGFELAADFSGSLGQDAMMNGE